MRERHNPTHTIGGSDVVRLLPLLSQRIVSDDIPNRFSSDSMSLQSFNSQSYEPEQTIASLNQLQFRSTLKSGCSSRPTSQSLKTKAGCLLKRRAINSMPNHAFQTDVKQQWQFVSGHWLSVVSENDNHSNSSQCYNYDAIETLNSELDDILNQSEGGIAKVSHHQSSLDTMGTTAETVYKYLAKETSVITPDDLQHACPSTEEDSKMHSRFETLLQACKGGLSLPDFVAWFIRSEDTQLLSHISISVSKLISQAQRAFKCISKGRVWLSGSDLEPYAKFCPTNSSIAESYSRLLSTVKNCRRSQCDEQLQLNDDNSNSNPTDSEHCIDVNTFLDWFTTHKELELLQFLAKLFSTGISNTERTVRGAVATFLDIGKRATTIFNKISQYRSITGSKQSSTQPIQRLLDKSFTGRKVSRKSDHPIPGIMKIRASRAFLQIPQGGDKRKVSSGLTPSPPGMITTPSVTLIPSPPVGLDSSISVRKQQLSITPTVESCISSIKDCDAQSDVSTCSDNDNSKPLMPNVSSQKSRSVLINKKTSLNGRPSKFSLSRLSTDSGRRLSSFKTRRSSVLAVARMKSLVQIADVKQQKKVVLISSSRVIELLQSCPHVANSSYLLGKINELSRGQEQLRLSEWIEFVKGIASDSPSEANLLLITLEEQIQYYHRNMGGLPPEKNTWKSRNIMALLRKSRKKDSSDDLLQITSDEHIVESPSLAISDSGFPDPIPGLSPLGMNDWELNHEGLKKHSIFSIPTFDNRREESDILLGSPVLTVTTAETSGNNGKKGSVFSVPAFDSHNIRSSIESPMLVVTNSVGAETGVGIERRVSMVTVPIFEGNKPPAEDDETKSFRIVTVAIVLIVTSAAIASESVLAKIIKPMRLVVEQQKIVSFGTASIARRVTHLTLNPNLHSSVIPVIGLLKGSKTMISDIAMELIIIGITIAGVIVNVGCTTARHKLRSRMMSSVRIRKSVAPPPTVAVLERRSTRRNSSIDEISACILSSSMTDCPGMSQEIHSRLRDDFLRIQNRGTVSQIPSYCQLHELRVKEINPINTFPELVDVYFHSLVNNDNEKQEGINMI